MTNPTALERHRQSLVSLAAAWALKQLPGILEALQLLLAASPFGPSVWLLELQQEQESKTIQERGQ